MSFTVPNGVTDLAGLEEALSPESMLAAFQRYIPPRDGSLWARCLLERVSYKPGKSARILYRLWKEGEARETGRPHYYYMEILPPARSLHRYLELQERGGPSAPSGFIAEIDCIYWEFPTDPRLSQLGSVWREGTWEVVTYTPTMSCVLAGMYAGEATIVKLYHDERVEHVSRAMDALRAAGVTAPGVRHVDAARRLLVLEHVPGVGFWSQPDQHLGRDVMGAMARQLAALHATIVPQATREALPQIDHGAREWARFLETSVELAAAFPEHAARLERLQTMLAQAHRESEPALLHGDFHPAQFLVENGTPRLIDYDNVCFGDPMYDLGRFASHLFYKGQVHGRPLAEIEAAVSAFRSAYIAAGNRFSATNWFWHLAVSLVAKRAHRVLTRLETGASACVAHLLGLAEQNAASIHRP